MNIATKQFDIEGDIQGGITIHDWRGDTTESWYLTPSEKTELFRKRLLAADLGEERVSNAFLRENTINSLCAEYFD